MVKNGDKKADMQKVKSIQKILITQPRPESDKSPYFELTRKYDVALEFQPFIRLEGIPAREFRKQKIEIPNYTGVVFTSRNAIDHFFRTCEEMKVSVYLQKFILYRKRKVFYGADGTNKSMFDVINKHKGNEKFLYVCSENQQDNEIVNWLKTNNCEFALAFMYRTQSNDVKELLTNTEFDIICFFTPSGIKSLFDNLPKFKQNGTVIGAFGGNTFKAAEEAGLKLEIKAPQPQAPSMVAALDRFLAEAQKNK